MGTLLAKLKSILFGRKLEIAVVGLENVGKSTFVNQLAHGESITTLPTVGVNIKFVKIKSRFFAKNRFKFEDIGFRRTKLFKARMAFICKDL